MSDIKEKDYYFPVLVSQIVIFIVLTTVIYLFGADGDFRQNYLALLNYNLDSAEMTQAVETFRKHLYDGEIFTVLNIKDDFPVAGYVDTDYSGAGGDDIEYRKAADKTSFAPVFSTVKILPPIEKGRYTSYFGYRISPITGEYGFHTGLDIAAGEGTKIRAAFSGKVLKTGFDTKAGNYLYLEHNDGLVTFYCHCSEVLVEKGTVVRQGETVALVGSTGYSTGPHLHFEVRKEDIRYNPMWLLGE
ncbi:MAG: M23 family metallopeptidase [Clostridia bacterium]|nr:M23 family metallopeptidase [Clostridia bacterium]